MAIGKNVQALRERRGLTFDAVAKAVGTDAQAISQMEKRDSKTSNYAVELARFFGVSLEELMGEQFDIDRALAARPTLEVRAVEPQLQWIVPQETELLSLYRAMAEPEQATILSICRSLPKAVIHGSNARGNES